MLELLFWLAIFVGSLALLVKSSDWFTGAAEKIGLSFGLPAFIIGVTIVSIGTSLPELVSSLIAVFSGSSEIVVGNVVGSNIANIFLILGITVIVAKKLTVKFDIIYVDLPILVGSAFLMGIMIMDGALTFFESLILIAGLAVYFHYTLSNKKKAKEVMALEKEIRHGKADWKAGAMLVLSSILIYVGARYVVNSIIELSRLSNIETEVIAVTAVALGTSLPELAVTLVAAKKGKAELAVGNILGSNIFNTFAVLGIPGLFSVLVIPTSIITFALPMMIIATVLFFFMLQEKIIHHWEGWLLLMFYVFFVGKLFNLI